MIDWPRMEVTQHLIQNLKSKIPNLCLIARRQQLPTQPCTFFWISDGLALDGVIRSDNRGSESLFPLYMRSGDSWQANFALAFIQQFESATRLAWLPRGHGDLHRTFGPEDLLAYVYALFHAPSYREKYAESLRRGFPRILPPRNRSAFSQLCMLGNELITLHTFRTSRTLHTFDDSVAKFRVGGHVALRKWLQPKHRSHADPDYSKIAAAIARTQEIMAAIGECFPVTS